MSHLGERVTALVDGQLPIDATERALGHVAGCDSCREAVETERLTKQRLATLGVPRPQERLIGALLELSGPAGPLPPRPGHVPGSPRPELVPGLTTGLGVGNGRPPSRRDPSRPSSLLPAPGGPRLGRSSRNRMAAAVVGAACLVGAGVAGGVANGQPADRPVVPPVDSFVLEHSVTAGSLPFGDQTVMWGAVGAGR